MAAIDFYCSADDRHRVILLAELLEKTGQRVTLRCEPPGTAPGVPETCLVACTRRALREPWIEALFTSGAQVVAIRLDDTPLPGPCARSIDMQAWPARSADRGVGRLVHWLRYGDEREPGRFHGGTGGARGAAGTPAGSDRAADAGPAAPPGAAADSAAWPRRRRTTRPDTDVVGGALLVGMLLAGGVALSMLADREADYDRSEPARHEPARPATTLSSTPLSQPPSAPMSQPSSAPASSRSSAAERPPDAPLSAPPARGGDAARPCLTAPPEAAEAWAGVLGWKPRRRVIDEVCMAKAVRPPAYERVALASGLSGAGARMR